MHDVVLHTILAWLQRILHLWAPFQFFNHMTGNVLKLVRCSFNLACKFSKEDIRWDGMTWFLNVNLITGWWFLTSHVLLTKLQSCILGYFLHDCLGLLVGFAKQDVKEVG
jgi:hypothetical protein